MREICGNCKYNKIDWNRQDQAFTCHNEDSDEYGVPTFYDDTCDEFEEKEY